MRDTRDRHSTTSISAIAGRNGRNSRGEAGERRSRDDMKRCLGGQKVVGSRCALPRRAARASGGAVVRAVRNVDYPEALLFDCDGVLVDTERDGHRVSFNKAFQEKGLDTVWDVELYGELLEIGGGKERMTAYFSRKPDEKPFADLPTDEEKKAFVAEMHKLKTKLFMDVIETGQLPLRPGVKRLVEEALANDVKVAVCSTSNENAVSAVVRVMLGEEIAKVMRVFAGDIVPKKKPDPAIYKLAAEELGVDPARCVVIEDSRIGMLAAKAAGMRCIVTKSSYTQEENFDIADAIFPYIGDGEDSQFGLHDLTTPGNLWLNPPLPMDADWNWIDPPNTFGEPSIDDLFL